MIWEHKQQCVSIWLNWGSFTVGYDLHSSSLSHLCGDMQLSAKVYSGPQSPVGLFISLVLLGPVLLPLTQKYIMYEPFSAGLILKLLKQPLDSAPERVVGNRQLTPVWHCVVVRGFATAQWKDKKINNFH